MGLRPFFGVFIGGALVALSACGNKAAGPLGSSDVDASDAAPQADTGSPEASPPDTGSDAFVEGPHAPLPEVPANGGPVLSHPKLVTITFTSPPDAGAAEGGISPTEVGAFGTWIVGSDWLSAVGKDYGVGLGTHVQVSLGPAPSGSITDDQVQALLLAHIQDGSLPSNATGDGATDDYLYEFFFPATTTAVSAPADLGGGTTCVEYGGGFLGGYHWQTMSPQVAYAVVPTCSGGGLVEGVADIEAEASHEFIEASTDPFPATDLGWAIIDPNSAWGFLDGEVADLCSPEQIEDSGFTVQRIWSNSAVTAGTNPCVPAPKEPFYDATTTPATVQNVKAGQTLTFQVQAFSNAPIMPWSVQAFTSDGTFDPSPTLSRSTLGNGQTATLTLTIPKTVMSQDYALVILNSSLSLEDYSYWPVAVQVP
jgi:hypothetical protein